MFRNPYIAKKNAFDLNDWLPEAKFRRLATGVYLRLRTVSRKVTTCPSFPVCLPWYYFGDSAEKVCCTLRARIIWKTNSKSLNDLREQPRWKQGDFWKSYSSGSPEMVDSRGRNSIANVAILLRIIASIVTEDP